jgi:hypothetical protein
VPHRDDATRTVVAGAMAPVGTLDPTEPGGLDPLGERALMPQHQQIRQSVQRRPLLDVADVEHVLDQRRARVDVADLEQHRREVAPNPVGVGGVDATPRLPAAEVQPDAAVGVVVGDGEREQRRVEGPDVEPVTRTDPSQEPVAVVADAPVGAFAATVQRRGRRECVARPSDELVEQLRRAGV